MMKRLMTIVAVALAAAVSGCGSPTAGKAPVKVIFDTDMLTDYDDAGALACLHALADAGECEILATVSCTRGNSSVAVCEAVNAWYGRPEIPVGCVKEIGVKGEGHAAADGNGHAKFRLVRDRYAPFVRYPNSDDAPDALEVYRKVLRAQPDRSVVICSVGFLSNLRRLLEAEPELVARKVRLWVAMACKYPKGREYNSEKDPVSSRIVLEKWPTPIVFSDFDYGRWVFAGRRITEAVETFGPVRDVFKSTLPPRAQCNDKTYDRPEGHPSWDETAVLYAVRGAGEVFGLERGSYRMVGDTGDNVWTPDPNGRDARLTEKLPKPKVGALIDELMCRQPKAKPVYMGSAVSFWTNFRVSCDRYDARYRCGETAEFTVMAGDEKGQPLKSGKVKLRLDNCGDKVVSEQEFDLAQGNPFKVRGTLDKPGFLRLRVCDGFDWSVAFEPEKIVKGAVLPPDFDEFWANARAKLAREVPLDAQVRLEPSRCTADFDYYRISFATFGRRVYGLMSKPKDASPTKRYPLVFEAAAAGLGDWSQNMYAPKDEIRVFMTAYDWEPQWGEQMKACRERYDKMNAELNARWKLVERRRAGYPCAGISAGRESYWFYPVILGIDRAIDWAAQLPEVDSAKGVRYQGTSQGGMFGLILTGLNKRITKTAVFVPAGCDTLGYLQDGRQSGWPQIVEAQSEANKAAALRWAPYFDGANFATRITCPIRLIVGYSDQTCCPPAVWAGFNACPSSDKGIVTRLNMHHNVDGATYEDYFKWLRAE